MVVENKNGTTHQHLLVSKARIAKKDMSIPRLELTAALTLVKLMINTCKALKKFEIKDRYAWVDSTTVLYWLANKGTWSQYIRNRVTKIQEFKNCTWRYVPTSMNPSDLGTRRANPGKLNDLWWNGPDWLGEPTKWPESPEIVQTKESSSELIKPKEKLFLQKGDENQNWQINLITKFSYWKLLRISAYIFRFANNCKNESKRTGPLTTTEIIQFAEKAWVRIAQLGCDEMKSLSLKKDDSGVFRYHGRVPDYYPVFIPRQHALAQKIIEHYHCKNVAFWIIFSFIHCND